MELTAITDRIESFKAFQLMQLRFFKDAEIFPHQPLGHQGGARQRTVFWLARSDLWAVLDLSAAEGGRYLNCFGRGRPNPQRTLPITVEINPPHEGVNKRAAGLFVRDEHGRYYIADTGKIGGGRSGITPTKFRSFVSTGW